MEAVKGDWVRVYSVVLRADERSTNLPEDTKKVPLEMWDKGFLIDNAASIGDVVTVATVIGRKIRGELVEVNPAHDVNYGECAAEILYIGRQLREMLGD